MPFVGTFIPPENGNKTEVIEPLREVGINK